MSKPIYAGVTKPANQIEDGKYGAILCQIIQVGNQHFQKENNGKVSEWDSPQIILGFELPTVTYEYKDETLTAVKSGKYFLSLNPSKNGTFGLREVMDGFRGVKEWTEEELEQFDIAQYLGKSCLITLEGVESKGKVYQNITKLEVVAGSDMIAEGKRVPVLITVEDFNNLELLDTLPLWIQDCIRSSKEYKALAPRYPADSAIDDVDEIKLEDVPF